jgi:hypothetical protein
MTKLRLQNVVHNLHHEINEWLGRGEPHTNLETKSKAQETYEKKKTTLPSIRQNTGINVTSKS